MFVCLYLQLHESQKKGGQIHGAEAVNVESQKGDLASLEDSSGQGRDDHVGACREACERLPEAVRKGGAAMRVEEGIYWRGNSLWIHYSFRGQTFRESARTDNVAQARKLRKERLKQVERPGFVGPKEEKWTLPDMLDGSRLYYSREGNRSFEDVRGGFKHLDAEDAFKFYRVVDITSEKIAEYGDKRLKAGAARASINYELTCLRRGFKLMLEKGMISTLPVIKL